MEPRTRHQDTTCATTLPDKAQGAVVTRMATETEKWMDIDIDHDMRLQANTHAVISHTKHSWRSRI